MPNQNSYYEQGQQLQRLRGIMSRKELAEKIGRTEDMVRKLEVGLTVPSKNTLAALASVFGEAVQHINWPKAYNPTSYNSTASNANTLKALRLALPDKPSQAEIAARLKISVLAYSNIERGVTTRPGKSLIDGLVQIYGEQVREMFVVDRS